MANPIYMTMGIHVVDGEAKTPSVKYHKDRNDADYQYHLYCANAAKSTDDIVTAVLMTATGFMIESKTWEHKAPDSEPHPETEQE